MLNNASGLVSYTEGDPPLDVGSYIVLRDEDSVNSNVTVSQVIVSVVSELEMIEVGETDSNVSVVSLSPQCYVWVRRCPD